MDLIPTLQLLGSLGEFFGAIAVVATLMFLVYELRQTRLVQKASTIQSWVQATQQNDSMLVASDLFEIIGKARRGLAGLDALERAKLSVFLNQNFNMWEALFLHHRHGLTDEDFYEAKMPFFVDQLGHAGIREYWDQISTRLYDPRFRAYVSAALDELERNQDA